MAQTVELKCPAPACQYRTEDEVETATRKVVDHYVGYHTPRVIRPDGYSAQVAAKTLREAATPENPNAANLKAVASWLEGFR